MKKTIMCNMICLFSFFSVCCALDDPWGRLRDQYKKKPATAVIKAKHEDPWSQLRSVCLRPPRGHVRDCAE